MSTDEALVNGVLLPGFLGTTVPEWLARALDAGLAGVCLFAQNVGPGLPELTARLHGRRAGVLVASDEEGGPVTRLDAPWPSAAALGRLDDVAATEAVGADVGARCRATGIDLALAPVADVNAEPDNPVIGIRSFGATPRLVARHVAAFVRGVQGAGTAATAKHFPGHGCTVLDSHLALPAVDDAADVVRARDLPPFAAAVEAGVRCVLTAHVRFGAFDDRPATMSPPLLALLRRELGFDGVVISDAVDMAAIAAAVGTGAGAVAAVAAGVDLVCIGNPRNGYDDEAGYRRVRDALLAAVGDGTLPRERLAEAGRRVAELAEWVRAARAHPAAAGGVDGVRLARRVAETAGNVRIGRGAHVVDLRGAVNIADGRAGEPRLVEALRRRDPTVTTGPDVPAEGPVVVVVRGPSTAFDRVRAARPDAVAVHVGLPGDWRPPAPSITLWGDGRAHVDVAAEHMHVP